ncbi:hypothetical protein [Stenomitos frigidus]|uniref:hypothetical protein n=1 Tax=Stenomitos frigidus TaxID=1886765 RepID=UPI0011B267A3|nr:hypothetical protein [Stenomitos frigidus]
MLQLQQTKLRNLDLSGTRIASSKLLVSPAKPPISTSINAREISVTGPVSLSDGFQAVGMVILRGATIGGHLDCSQGKFINEGNDALFAQSAKITGSVWLSDGFEAVGMVSLVNATIGGVLDCSQGKFTNEGNDALVAQSAKVTVDVYLCNGFEAIGSVILLSATIGGDLNCSGGKFTNEGNDALVAQSAKVTGDVSLNDNFQAVGEVNLRGATIGGDLNCSKGKFTNQDKSALVLLGTKIMGAVWLSKGFQAVGMVSLVDATMGRDLNCSQGKFTNEGNDALVAQNAKVTGDVSLNDNFQAIGRVSLFGANIGGDLNCSGGKFTNEDEDKFALVAIDANIKGYIYLDKGFQAIGKVNLFGATIGGDLDCSGGKFTNEGKAALVAQNAKVTGGVFLSDNFQAIGRVSLFGATIGGDLDCSGGKFTNEGKAALVAQNAKVTGGVFLSDNFQAIGRVSLFGATIGGDLDCSGGKFTNEGKAALVAQNAKVTGGVFLSDNFQAIGKVSLFGATIGGDLNCSGRILEDEQVTAILCLCLKIDRVLQNKLSRKAVKFWLNLLPVKQNKAPEEAVKPSLGVFLILVLKHLMTARAKSVSALEFFVVQDLNRFMVKRAESIVALLADAIDVKGNVSLKDFKVEGLISLYGARVGKTLEIARIRAPQGMALDLRFAQVQTFEHAENSLPLSGNLALNGLAYEVLGTKPLQNCERHLTWLRLQPKALFSSQPYEQLAKVLRSVGEGDEAVKVLIGRENDLLQRGNLHWFSKGWKRFLGYTIAYGYHPEWALIWGLVVVVAGSFLFNVGYQHGLISATDKDCKPPTLQQVDQACPNHPKFNPIIYSLDVFLPIVDLRLKTYWLPNATKGVENPFFHIKWGALLRYYFWLHIISGWVLTTLWVAGFSGLVRNSNK